MNVSVPCDMRMCKGRSAYSVSYMPFMDYFEAVFYNMLMNAYASEQAARMSAMSNANENAKEISASLTIIYNKSRQEKITNEILDLANGQIH